METGHGRPAVAAVGVVAPAVVEEEEEEQQQQRVSVCVYFGAP